MSIHYGLVMFAQVVGYARATMARWRHVHEPTQHEDITTNHLTQPSQLEAITLVGHTPAIAKCQESVLPAGHCATYRSR